MAGARYSGIYALATTCNPLHNPLSIPIFVEPMRSTRGTQRLKLQELTGLIYEKQN